MIRYQLACQSKESSQLGEQYKEQIISFWHGKVDGNFQRHFAVLEGMSTKIYPNPL